MDIMEAILLLPRFCCASNYRRASCTPPSCFSPTNRWPDEALVISGAGESGAMKIVPPGGKVFVVPILQSTSKISLEAYKIPL